MCKDQLCVKHAKFLSPFLTNARKKKKARVFIILIVKTFWGEVGGFGGGGGGEDSPPHPPVDETLNDYYANLKLHAVKLRL